MSHWLLLVAVVPCVMAAGPPDVTSVPMVALVGEPAIETPTPIVDWRYVSPPGWYAGVEVAVVRPTIDYFDFFSGARHIQLDTAVEPAVRLGWRGLDGRALQIDYRFLHASGNQQSFVGSQGTTSFNVNWIDLAYYTGLRQPCSWYGYQWEFGPRFAFMDQRERAYYNGLSWRADRISFAGGVHGGYAGNFAIGETGFGILHSVDLGLMGGHSVYKQDGGRNVLSDGVVDFRAELGLSYTMPRNHWLRWEVGVQDEWIGWHGIHGDWGGFLRCVVGF